MFRRNRRGLLALLAWLPLVAAGCGAGAPPERRPDVLLVSLDTLRADRLSCYGNPRDTTPRLDALAGEGVRFAECHAPSSNTKPSHMSVFTGLDPLAHDVRPVRLRAKVRPSLSPSVPTLPELLRAAGYATASFTDRGGLPPSAGFARGFDHLRAEWEELPRKIAAVGRWLADRSADRPVFVFFHTYETHAPYLPPPPFRGRYTDPAYRGEFLRRYEALAGSPMAEFWREKGRFLDPWPEMGPEDVRFASDLYDEEVAWTDQQVGRLVASFRRARGERVLVAVMSDHGEEFFEHAGLGHQRSLHGELVRVPLILAGPGLPAGRVVEEPVSLTGLLPTLLELLDLPAVETQVPSFLALARGGRAAVGPIYSQVGNREAELLESVTDGRLRLVRTVGEEGDRAALYDWAADPDEQADLAARRPADAARLAELLDGRRDAAERLRERHPAGEEEARPSESEARELEGLGYAGDDE